MQDLKCGNECQVISWEDDGSVDALPGTAARPSAAEPIQSVIQRAVTRRALLKGGVAAGAGLVIAPALLLKPSPAAADDDVRDRRGRRDPGSRLTFQTVEPSFEGDIVVPPNYAYDVILRWGDPLFPGTPDFDLNDQTPEKQALQFGYNADLVLWYPLPEFVRKMVQWRGELGSIANRWLGSAYPRLKDAYSRRALVIVNHEYTTGADMFPGYSQSRNEALVEIEAHGFSIVELAQDRDGRWSFDQGSPFNRRVTGSTPMEISGPLRGMPEMQTADDPNGKVVLGCLNNCAGGKTPWGTILTCEENFDQYFANFGDVAGRPKDLSLRIAAESADTERKWEDYVDRFDLSKEPNEYNRFGFIVEIDPYNPQDKPKKRTALGRFKHEGAAARVAPNGKVAIYSGDDARFEYVYKFVTKGRYNPGNRSANLNLLDEGTLYVARFDVGAVEGDEMGIGQWLELSTNNPALVDWTETEILLNTRGAADVVGATPMDRPEDIEVNPKSGRLYVALTNNSQRTGAPGSGATRDVNGREVSTEPNASNPRFDTWDNGVDSNTGNEHGHIIELIEDGNDPTSTSFKWNIFVQCGDPNVAYHDVRFGDIADPVAAGVSPISDPDNLVHDDEGNLWIATDGMPGSGGTKGFGQNDGVFAVPVEGEHRGLLRQFLSGVPGGEVCGPEFSGDNKTFFCAIQHPYEGKGVGHENKWPLGEPVSKPSLVAVRELSGKKIGA
ncbi:PhoX family protein [Thiohalocapsa marina]|uniref:PhoX family protein n=1 Tax=Thiohalocapsa marina TaxID=424902 RepID=UPI0036DAEE87